MKRRFSFPLFLSLVALVANFLLFWHDDTIIDRITVFFAFIPWTVGIGLLLAGLICSLVSVVRNCSSTTNWVAFSISILTILMVFLFPFRDARVRLEFELYEKDRMEIIEMVKDGAVVPDHIGNADLPKGYKHTSSDGNIFIFRNDEEQVISFWVFRGMLSGSVHLVYSSQDDALIYENLTTHPITDVLKLKDHWYLVHTDY